MDARSSVWAFVKHYTYGCFAKAWNGAIAAVYGVIGITTGAAFDPEHFSAPNFYTLGYIFGVAWLINCIDFFRLNPLPPVWPDTEPPVGAVSPK